MSLLCLPLLLRPLWVHPPESSALRCLMNTADLLPMVPTVDLGVGDGRGRRMPRCYIEVLIDLELVEAGIHHWIWRREAKRRFILGI